MNWFRCATLLALALFTAGCGVSPKVRVERAPGSATASNPSSRSGALPSQPSARQAAHEAHVVTKGDTLYSIAFRNGLDVRELIAWNRIQVPYTIYPGQSLRLKPEQEPRASSLSARPSVPPAAAPLPATSAATAPAHTTTAPAPASAVPPGHVAGVGTRPVLDHSQPVRVEALDAPATTVVAPRPAARVSPVTAPAARAPGSLIAAIESPPKSNPPPGQAASPGYRPAPTATPATAAAAVASTAPIPTATPTQPPVATSTSTSTPAPRIDASGPSQTREGILWRWPTAGSVLGRFVPGDPTQQGIDIGGKLGQAVTAVADGEVVYSGNGLLGYGEMIIVQHSPDYLSAYGHNQRRLAAEGDKVKAGQMIAEMGQRGSQVILHFEVRRRGKPVDPLAYLPAR